MSELEAEVIQAAERAIASVRSRGGESLDYSETSLSVVEAALAEAARFAAALPPHVVDGLAQDFGSYVLEVGRRNHGGRYAWLEQSSEPVLITGEPDRHIAIAAWRKVRGRLVGDAADNVEFFYAGYARRVKDSPNGAHVFLS